MKNKLSRISVKLLNTGFYHIFSSNVINKIITFFSGILLVRIIPKENYGVYSYATNILSFFMLLSGMGMVSGAFQLCCENSKNQQMQKNICNYAYRYGILINVFLSFIILLFSYFINLPIHGANELLSLMAFIPLITIAFEFRTIYLRSTLQNRRFSYANMANSFFMFFFSVIGAILLQIKGLIIAHYIAYIITIIFMQIVMKTKIGFLTVTIQKELKKSLFSISLITMVNNAISQLLYLLDIFILGIVTSNANIIASYKIATTIPTALTFIPNSIMIYVYPYFAAHREDPLWVREKSIQLISALAILNGFISLTLFISAPYIVKTVFGSQYEDSLVIFRILCFNYFLSGTLRIPAGNILVTQRKLKFNLFTDIISGGVNIIGDYLLISSYGSYGAAFTTVLVVLISSVLSIGYLFRLTNRNKNAPYHY